LNFAKRPKKHKSSQEVGKEQAGSQITPELSTPDIQSIPWYLDPNGVVSLYF
jgi:hypothetical protein